MKSLRVLAIGVAIGGIGISLGTTASATEWAPRTVEQIKADIGKTNGKEYTIVWGDTLSGISGATNISIQKLAEMNKIANLDIIFAGNKLVFDGNVATVQNSQGQTVTQSVIQETEKIDPNKPIGTPVAPSSYQNDAAVTNEQASVPSPPATSVPSQPTTNESTVQHPSQPAEATTPPKNENSGGTTAPSTDGNQGGGSGETGVVEPTTPLEKFTVWYTASDPADAAHNIAKGTHVFDTEAEATAWIDNYADNLLGQNVASSSYGVSSYQV